MRHRVAAALVLLASAQARAQVDRSIPRDLIEQRIEIAAERLGDDSDVDLTNLFETLIDLYRHPLDLNHARTEELEAMSLLSDAQIAALQDHIQKEGPLLSIYELQTIDAFDPATLELVRPFVTVRESTVNARASLKDILKNADHDLAVRSITDVQQRKGYMYRDNIFGNSYTDPEGDPLPDYNDPAVLDSLRRDNKVYLGSPYKLYARYRFRYRQNLSLGVTAEKDEGEEFFQGSQPDGFDFYSAHLFVRDVGPVKALAIGDYQAQFGQGLTYWNGLAFASKSSYTMDIKRSAPGLMPYTSVNENQFLRGVGATIGLGEHFDITGFYSDRTLDANVAQLDTNVTVDQEATFSSFLEDGLHRTTSELNKKDAIHEKSVGGHLRYRQRNFSAGFTAVNAAYDLDLARDLQPYNQFEFSAGEVTTYGLDWNLMHRNLSWFGEGAMSDNGGMAGLTGVLLALDKRVSLSMLYRDYGRDFQGLHSNSFAEGSHPWNERGLYSGIEIRPDRRWSINAYFDQFRFPWLRYQTDAPSSGNDWLAQLTWKPSRGAELYGRVRHRNYQKNAEGITEGIDPLVPVTQTNYRFNASYKVSGGVGLRTRIEVVDFQRGAAATEHGFLVYQDVVHRPLHSMAEFTFRVALFQTDSYDARVYAYENDLIGLFSIPPYYGRGMRWYAMLRLTPLRKVDLWLRYGSWIYNDQSVYSSGLQEITGDPVSQITVRSDVKVQLRVRF